VRQRAEQRLVEKLIPQLPVEALAGGVLLRLARLNVLPANAALVRPLQDRIRGQIASILARMASTRAVVALGGGGSS
jgi:hypothetical protein